MRVKMLARWSELSPRNNHINKEDADLKRLISGEEDPEAGMIMMDIVHEYGPVVFDLKDVKRYNRSKEKDHTTVTFADESSLVLKVNFLDFMELEMEQLGINILDCTPLDYVDGELEEDRENNEEDLEL